jgi:hypothetical protein
LEEFSVSFFREEVAPALKIEAIGPSKIHHLSIELHDVTAQKS